MCIYNFSISIISRRRSSIGQTLIKIKHKVKWLVKVVKNKKFIPHYLITLSRGFLAGYGFYIFVTILKKFFLNKQKCNCFKKISIFFFYTYCLHKY